MKLLNWNIEGLKTVVNSIPQDIFNQVDVCTLTETFIIDTSKVNIRGFY
jgi:exonuclease III